MTTGANAMTSKDARPLRRVVGGHVHPITGRWIERLECGHEQPAKRDIYGDTVAARRRCRQCSSKVAK